MEYFKLKLIPEAQEDIRAALSLLKEDEELYASFRTALYKQLSLIEKYPKQNPKILRKNIWKAEMKSFPFMVIYEIQLAEKQVIVLGIFPHEPFLNYAGLESHSSLTAYPTPQKMIGECRESP